MTTLELIEQLQRVLNPHLPVIVDTGQTKYDGMGNRVAIMRHVRCVLDDGPHAVIYVEE